MATVEQQVNAEAFAFVRGSNWLVTCNADGTIPLNSRIVAEFVKEPPEELIAAMEMLPQLLAVWQRLTAVTAKAEGGAS